MDWSAVFDEAYPAEGACEDIVAELVSSIGEPLSDLEIASINFHQQNPFPDDDPLHAAYRPFDPLQWKLATRKLPQSYLAFLRWSDGGEFRTGERWFQFFPALEVREMLLAYHLPRYMPGSIPIAFNGGGTFYLFDMRQEGVGGEYPVVCSHSGNLGWKPDQSVQIAESFLTACQGRVNVDDLR